jgi:hypothetical protein
MATLLIKDFSVILVIWNLNAIAFINTTNTTVCAIYETDLRILRFGHWKKHATSVLRLW